MYKNLDDHIRKTKTEEEWIEKLRKIKDFNVRDTSSLGHTPLTASACYGHTEGCKYILNNGGDVNLQNKDGETALLLTIKASNYGDETILFLLDQGADINIADNDGVTSLMQALRYYPNPDFIKLLLEKGAEVNAANKWKMTPLMYAAETRNIAIYKALLEKGADPSNIDIGGCTALYYLVKASFDTDDKINMEEIIDLLPQDQHSLNMVDSETGDSILYHAARNGYLKLVKTILENKVDLDILNDKRETPTLIACKREQYEVFEFLLKQNADITLRDNDNNTVIALAQKYANQSGVNRLENILIKHNIELPLKLGEIDINEVDKKGNTALHLATKERGFGTLEKMQELIERGADVNLQNKQGKTALMMACLNGTVEKVEILLKNRADVNIQDKYGKTALIHLMDDTYYGDNDREKFDLLTDTPVINVNLQTKAGMTALMHICKQSCVDHYYVEKMLMKGAQVDIETSKGKTALSFIKDYDTSLKEFLLKVSAQTK